MWRTDSIWLEVAVVLGIFAVGNILFGHFEQHNPPARRLAKVAVVLGITLVLSSTVGRAWGLGWLLLPLGAAAYIHLRWLPKHGVNGWTGEPRDRYLALIARRRGRTGDTPRWPDRRESVRCGHTDHDLEVAPGHGRDPGAGSTAVRSDVGGGPGRSV